jgi:hypothetical protein
MERTAIAGPTSEDAAGYEAAIDRCIAAVRRMREEMAEDQREIERLRAETRAILAELKAA